MDTYLGCICKELSEKTHADSRGGKLRFSSWTCHRSSLTTWLSVHQFSLKFCGSKFFRQVLSIIDCQKERIYMKRASTSKLIWIRRQFVSQNNKAKDLLKISESGTPVKTKNSTCFRQLPGEWGGKINLLWKFLNFRSVENSFFFASKNHHFLHRLQVKVLQGTLFAANLELYTNLVVVCLCSSI